MTIIAVLKRIYDVFQRRRLLRVLLQSLVSLALIGVLVSMVRSTDMLASFRALDPGALLFALGLQVVAFVLNSRRWQLLLANVGISERLLDLAVLYFIGQFFSLFLPTGTGGDVVRVYDVGRRSGRLAQAALATLQERLLGLGASLAIGLVAAIYYLPLVPPQLRVWIGIIQIAGAIGIALLLYPALLFALAGRFWRAYGQRPALQQFAERPLVARVARALQPIGALPPLRPLRLALLLGMAFTAVLMGIGMYYTIGLSLGIQIGFMAFCLVVPLVWIVRMAPVSLNGLGLGEGAFVVLMGWFAVPADKSLVLALAFLGLQTCCALFGGVFLLLRMARGSWASARHATVE
jgi:glycosyltransferase 2 family protein